MYVHITGRSLDMQTEFNFESDDEIIFVFAISRQFDSAFARKGQKQFLVEVPGQVIEVTAGVVERNFSANSFTPIDNVACRDWREAMTHTTKLLHDGE